MTAGQKRGGEGSNENMDPSLNPPGPKQTRTIDINLPNVTSESGRSLHWREGREGGRERCPHKIDCLLGSQYRKSISTSSLPATKVQQLGCEKCYKIRSYCVSTHSTWT